MPHRPPPRLYAMDNVIVTPHIAAFTREGQDRVVNAVCADVRRILKGEPAKNHVKCNQPKSR